MQVNLHPTRLAQYVGRKATDRAVRSTHLVDMDCLLSPHEVQRLTGKKLTISFSGSTIQVDELDVKVVDRV
ncbi:bacteriocin [Vibrio vulnificus]|nr:bacteriocin [Vibrio vulnificus]EIE1228425.1 bacteriocin [Vibrio vulnificus]EJS4045430.1 bacteriocin [Vibrio vulnificus]EJS4046695.1 bacteriocin [Vibrio vulnificus]